MFPSTPRWHVASPTELVVRQWPGDEEHIVFNGLSGDLHLLNPSATAVLEHLAKAPASLDELLASFHTVDRSALETVLASLDRLGLISPLL